MAEEDKHKTAFVTEWGTYCYKVMSFGLKNAGVTYQRMTTTFFNDLMHKEIEVCVDDMMVKSETRGEHIEALEKFLELVDKYNLQLNTKKCMFGVMLGKLLGHTVGMGGIEVDP